MEALADVAAGHLEQVVLVELLEDGALQLHELEKKGEERRQKEKSERWLILIGTLFFLSAVTHKTGGFPQFPWSIVKKDGGLFRRRLKKEKNFFDNTSSPFSSFGGSPPPPPKKSGGNFTQEALSFPPARIAVQEWSWTSLLLKRVKKNPPI